MTELERIEFLQMTNDERYLKIEDLQELIGLVQEDAGFWLICNKPDEWRLSIEHADRMTNKIEYLHSLIESPDSIRKHQLVLL